MKRTLIVSLLLASAPALAQMLGFSCEGKEGPTESHVWKYRFEIDRKTLKGIQSGFDYGGSPYRRDIELVFTPERMLIRNMGARDFNGFIDRRTLLFSLGGAEGACKAVSVAKRGNQF